MKRVTTIAAISMLALAGGCATVLRGTEQTVDFRTVPEGASVEIYNKPLTKPTPANGMTAEVNGELIKTLTTPADISLKRLKSYSVRISKPNYRTMEFKLIPEWDGVSLVGNLIMPGGSAGILLDTASGADKRFYEMAEVIMIPATQPTDPPLVLKTYKGHLMNDGQYEVAVLADQKDRSQFFRGQP